MLSRTFKMNFQLRDNSCRVAGLGQIVFRFQAALMSGIRLQLGGSAQVCVAASATID
jgi:hypothetical protein